MSKKALIWFRRDLRLQDNPVIHYAIEAGYQLIPLFIFDESIYKSSRVGAPRLQFWINALHDLDEQLQALGSRLVIRRGEPIRVLQNLITQTNSSALHFNSDITPYARRRDAEISEQLSIEVNAYDASLIMPPSTVLKSDGTPYKVFTPFKRLWNTKPKREIYQYTLSTDNFAEIDIETNTLPTVADLGYSAISAQHPPATRQYAESLVDDFVHADMTYYTDTRNDLPISPYENRVRGTSYLSPYLRLGIISPHEIYWQSREKYANTRVESHRESIETFVSELTWRDFYGHILWHYPHVLKRDFVDTYLNLEWDNDPEMLQQWQQGMTGYPIIDAPMRQLVARGWMPNRARMIVSSFLTKHLLIHWKYGDIFFMQHLIDGDTASNNGGWQWASGTSTDAQPYFRIFNPINQSKKFATPEYLRYWVPELKSVPDKHIHTPWEMLSPPKNYPSPIVEHKFARQRALDAFKQARGDK